MSQPEGTTQPVRLSRRSTLAYGFGASAYGIKDFCFASFLLLFYNQVLGLPAAHVGFAIMCALLLDAAADPIIGHLSDRTRGKWGRRHPWMYASAIPIAVGWLLLWNPPALSDSGMLLWVFAMSVLVRTAVSAYEVPSQALTPELSSDYDERTRIMSYRYLFGWAGGMAMLALSYGWLLAPEPGQDNGLLNRSSYPLFSLVAALGIVIAILASAAGTHREIKRFPKLEILPKSLSQHFAELLESVRNRAFLTLMIAGLCYYSAQGISFALSNYLYVHVWRFSGATFQILAAVTFLGVIFAFLIAPRVARAIGKPKAAMLFMAASAILQSLPYILRITGPFPSPGDAMLLPILFTFFATQIMMAVSATMLGASMMADVAEDSESKTGRRTEGIFFAGSFFVQKCCSGVGIFVAGLILHFSGFPDGAMPGTVPVEAIDRLTLLFIACYFSLGLLAAIFYRRFPFGREEHQARLAALAAERG